MSRCAICLSAMILVLLAGMAQAQSCLSNARITTPQSRFVIGADGQTVFDVKTNLTWQRCPMGYSADDGDTPQMHSDDRCVEDGETTFLWQEALLAAQDVNQTGAIDGSSAWYVPNIKELQSIVERQCFSPAINLTVFPPIDNIARRFWSSSVDTATGAYVLNFNNGISSTDSGDRGTDANLVRLVRVTL